MKDSNTLVSLENDTSRKRSYIFRIALIASVGGFLFGYDLVIIAGALPFLTDYFQLSPVMKGFAVSSAIMGSIAGPLLGLWFTEKIGRRRTMMIAGCCFIVSAVGSALSFTIWDFALWRFIGGMGIGLAMISSPIYIAEISPPARRGRLVNVNQLSNVIGINLAVIIGFLFSSNQDGWRWMFGTEILPTMILILGLLYIPESPRWLIDKKRKLEAFNVLSRINGDEIAKKEMLTIEQDLTIEKGKFKELFDPGTRMALIVGIILMVFSQINGVNMMLLYAPTILNDAGVSFGSSSILTSIPIYLFILICTIIAFGLIGHFSRKKLLITSVFFMAIGHLVMALMLSQHWNPLLTLIPMFIGTGAFTLGLAPLSWIIVSEIFPNKIRGKAMAIVCFFLFLSSFLTAQFFPVLMDWFNSRFNNSAGVYLIFALVCFGCLIFSWKRLPETKGVSLENTREFWRVERE